MIVRKLADGSHIIVGQPDHARLSGTLAAHWGNRDFAAPEPRVSVIRAAAYHDCGWVSYEARPTYNVETKGPPNHTQVPLDAQQLAGFQSGLDWIWGIDAYAGLLVSRHRTGLWRSRYGAVAHPAPPPPRKLPPEGEEFVARNEAKQEAALAGLDRTRFLVNYQLLQMFDFLSLYLCTGDPGPDRLEAVPTSYNGDGRSGVAMTMTPLGDGRIRLAPYPFDIPELAVGYIHLHMPARDYSSTEEFHRAYFGTPLQVKSYTYVK